MDDYFDLCHIFEIRKFDIATLICEAYIGGIGMLYIPGSKQESIPYPLSKLENIPLIKFPKYPVSMEVNKTIPEFTNTKIDLRVQEHFVKHILHVMVCVL